ncbi:hypothetical protein ACIREM_40930 [Streptomyces shenzhenensis]|uniref:hypothetical protein n=1 Tax=Streptomyces shenzhenensis TaxID=943815 RepID=UPI0038019123
MVQESLDLDRLPLPGVLVGELRESLQQRKAWLDRRVEVEEPRALLPCSTLQHRIEHGGLGIEVDNPLSQNQAGTTWKLRRITHVAYDATSLSLIATQIKSALPPKRRRVECGST